MPIRIILGLAVLSVPAWALMPTAEQNALVKKHCAVCHTDSARNGGLSLQHYDAAKRDPVLAAMLLSKLNSGAMGAAGIALPSEEAQQAWLDATKKQAAGAEAWFVTREEASVSASIVREVPSRTSACADKPLYRVKVTCKQSTGAGEIELTWSPQPQTGRTMTASVDGARPLEYKIEGQESMGNGGTAQTGHASIFLSDGKARKLTLPNRSLIIRELFSGETVEFPFSELDKKVRAEFHKCF
jgi:hypothetical protein